MADFTHFNENGRAADTVLVMFAVSQFTLRLMELRISEMYCSI